MKERTDRWINYVSVFIVIFTICMVAIWAYFYPRTHIYPLHTKDKHAPQDNPWKLCLMHGDEVVWSTKLNEAFLMPIPSKGGEVCWAISFPDNTVKQYSVVDRQDVQDVSQDSSAPNNATNKGK